MADGFLGNNATLKVDPAGGSPVTALHVRSGSYSYTNDTLEKTVLGDSRKSYIKGMSDLSITATVLASIPDLATIIAAFSATMPSWLLEDSDISLIVATDGILTKYDVVGIEPGGLLEVNIEVQGSA